MVPACGTTTKASFSVVSAAGSFRYLGREEVGREVGLIQLFTQPGKAAIGLL